MLRESQLSDRIVHSDMILDDEESLSKVSKLQMSHSYDDLTSVEDFTDTSFIDYNLFNVEIAGIREKLKKYPFANRVLIMGLNKEKEKVESKLYASFNEMVKEIAPDCDLIDESEEFIYDETSRTTFTEKSRGELEEKKKLKLLRKAQKKKKKKKKKKKNNIRIKTIKGKSKNMAYSNPDIPNDNSISSSTDDFTSSISIPINNSMYPSYQRAPSSSSSFTDTDSINSPLSTSDLENMSMRKSKNRTKVTSKKGKKKSTFFKVKKKQYWIDIQAPTEDDMTKIEKFFGLHPLTTEDCLDNDSGEKWEVFPKYIFVCVHAVNTLLLKQFRKKKKKVELNILIFHDFVLTIHHQPIAEIDMILKRIEIEFETRNSFKSEKEKTLWRKANAETKYNPERSKRKYGSHLNSKKLSVDASFDSLVDYVEEKMKRKLKRNKKKNKTKSKNSRKKKKNLKIDEKKKVKTMVDLNLHSKKLHMEKDNKMLIFTRPCWILYAFLDAMIDLFVPLAEDLLLETDNLYDLVLDLDVVESEEVNILRGLNNVKVKINVMRKHLVKKKSIVMALTSRIMKFIKKETSIYLRDVEDHIKECVRKLDAAKESLNQSHSNYMVKLSVEIANSSRATDDFMNKITILGTVLTPLALISGVWGMNMPVPGDCRFERNVATGLYWFWGILICMLFISLIGLVFFFPQLFSLNKMLQIFEKIIQYLCFWRSSKNQEDQQREARRKALADRLLSYRTINLTRNREFVEFKEEFNL